MIDSCEVIIEAGRGSGRYWRDLWTYRGLLFFLAWRDILVRYKQTALGIAWAVLRPLLMMAVFTILFGKLAKLPSEGVPYPILVQAGLLPWQLFANSFSESGDSLIRNAGMISKVYFPRMIIPLSGLLNNYLDFLISSVLLAGLMVWFGFMPSWRVVILPFFILVASAAAIGAGLWIAALNVKYRDFRYLVPFLVQFGLYVSPVGYSSGVVPSEGRLLYSLNPMVGVIDGFRWALLGANVTVYWPGFALGLVVVLLLFASGVWYFRRTEQTFADII